MTGDSSSRDPVPRCPNIPISHFAGDKGDDFKNWLQNEFEIKFQANGWPEKYKPALLGVHLDGHAKFLFTGLDDTVKNDYARVISALETGLMTEDRKRFLSDQYDIRTQKPSETVSEYAQALTELARSALSYMTLDTERQINLRNKFISGLTPRIREEVKVIGPKNMAEAMIAAERIETKLATDDQVTSHLEGIARRLETIESRGNRTLTAMVSGTDSSAEPAWVTRLTARVNQLCTNESAPSASLNSLTPVKSETTPPPWATQLITRIEQLESRPDRRDAYIEAPHQPPRDNRGPTSPRFPMYGPQQFTPNGRPVCQICNIVGHTALNCRNNTNRPYCGFHRTTTHSAAECRSHPEQQHPPITGNMGNRTSGQLNALNQSRNCNLNSTTGPASASTVNSLQPIQGSSSNGNAGSVSGTGTDGYRRVRFSEQPTNDNAGWTTWMTMFTHDSGPKGTWTRYRRTPQQRDNEGMSPTTEHAGNQHIPINSAALQAPNPDEFHTSQPPNVSEYHTALESIHPRLLPEGVSTQHIRKQTHSHFRKDPVTSPMLPREQGIQGTTFSPYFGQHRCAKDQVPPLIPTRDLPNSQPQEPLSNQPDVRSTFANNPNQSMDSFVHSKQQRFQPSSSPQSISPNIPMHGLQRFTPSGHPIYQVCGPSGYTGFNCHDGGKQPYCEYHRSCSHSASDCRSSTTQQANISQLTSGYRLQQPPSAETGNASFESDYRWSNTSTANSILSTGGSNPETGISSTAERNTWSATPVTFSAPEEHPGTRNKWIGMLTGSDNGQEHCVHRDHCSTMNPSCNSTPRSISIHQQASARCTTGISKQDRTLGGAQTLAKESSIGQQDPLSQFDKSARDETTKAFSDSQLLLTPSKQKRSETGPLVNPCFGSMRDYTNRQITAEPRLDREARRFRELTRECSKCHDWDLGTQSDQERYYRDTPKNTIEKSASSRADPKIVTASLMATAGYNRKPDYNDEEPYPQRKQFNSIKPRQRIANYCHLHQRYGHNRTNCRTLKGRRTIPESALRPSCSPVIEPPISIELNSPDAIIDNIDEFTQKAEESFNNTLEELLTFTVKPKRSNEEHERLSSAAFALKLTFSQVVEKLWELRDSNPASAPKPAPISGTGEKEDKGDYGPVPPQQDKANRNPRHDAIHYTTDGSASTSSPNSRGNAITDSKPAHKKKRKRKSGLNQRKPLRTALSLQGRPNKDEHRSRTPSQSSCSSSSETAISQSEFGSKSWWTEKSSSVALHPRITPIFIHETHILSWFRPRNLAIAGIVFWNMMAALAYFTALLHSQISPESLTMASSILLAGNCHGATRLSYKVFSVLPNGWFEANVPNMAKAVLAETYQQDTEFHTALTSLVPETPSLLHGGCDLVFTTGFQKPTITQPLGRNLFGDLLFECWKQPVKPSLDFGKLLPSSFPDNSKFLVVTDYQGNGITGFDSTTIHCIPNLYAYIRTQTRLSAAHIVTSYLELADYAAIVIISGSNHVGDRVSSVQCDYGKMMELISSHTAAPVFITGPPPQMGTTSQYIRDTNESIKKMTVPFQQLCFIDLFETMDPSPNMYSSESPIGNELTQQGKLQMLASVVSYVPQLQLRLR